MLQNGIEKSNFSDGPFSVLSILTKLWWAVARLIWGAFFFIKVVYSESGKHILQPGSEIFDIPNIAFQT